MTDDSASVGMLGVVAGAALVAMIGLGVLFASGKMNTSMTTVKLDLPMTTTGTR